MAKPWGTITDLTGIEVFDLYTQGYSVSEIMMRMKLTEPVVTGFIKSVPFQMDLKLLMEDAAYKDMLSPRRRVLAMQNRALDALSRAIDNPQHKKHIEAAQDILDRGDEVPRGSRITQSGNIVPAEELQMIGTVLRELAAGMVQGALQAAQSAPSESGDVIDVTPRPTEPAIAAGS